MTPLMLIGVSSVVWVLAFDTGASIASRFFGISYARLAVVSLFSYIIVGAIAGRYVQPLLAAAIVGIMGAVDATAGWAISWSIGPGRPPPERRSSSAIARASASVTITAAILGLVSALVSRAI